MLLATQPIDVTNEITNEMIEERNKEIQALCEEMSKVNDLFVLIGGLVDDQGQQTDVIGYNIHTSKNKCEGAVKDLEGASKESKSYASYIIAGVGVIIGVASIVVTSVILL